MKRSIRYEKTYPHPPEKLWKLIADSKILSEWLMPNDLLPVVGHKFTFKTKPGPGFDGIVYCVVLEVVVNEKLVYSWTGGPIKNSMVSWTLTALNGETHLLFEHTGFEGLAPVAISFLLGRGWKKNIYKLFDQRLKLIR
ncbi:SRPBCC family protein [Mucilaginibacter polytrichastri]|uniref:Activator of Hsp90 ATPase homologue 1/2-like C-terminal domain-containing protein n=1 Tax=Mucilaginibacter polytrichastri TaxID=1302689 RepID=A0A1Q6A5X8_9SPHI|nr:SRPBCC domain-containing protein [Mucilaginibacter polytrichastri]OKS89415.1 hypothetical protein RG47T_4899 [Mucilaginibacter polytrichastri]SFS72950.1 Uncharacterized conserved protein YndB, AHSA1/START domain [Mucilaginibacter polytrichastri]